jgi:carbon starvation protein CstA
VVAAPITSGDTAFRSARLIIADFLHFEQHSIRRRLTVCIPMFAAAIALLLWQMSDAEGFNRIWSWFGWSNQTLSVFTLWTLTVYLVLNKKNYWITLIPALFMTTVCVTFIFVSPQAFNLSQTLSYALGGVTLALSIIWFVVWMVRRRKGEKE